MALAIRSTTGRILAALILVACLAAAAETLQSQPQLKPPAANSGQQSNSSSSSDNSSPVTVGNQQQNLSSILKWLKLASGSSEQRDARLPRAAALTSGVAVEVSPPPSNMLFQYLPAINRKQRDQQPQSPQAAALTSHTLVATAHRSAKLELPADQQNQQRNPAQQTGGAEDSFNLFVSNTCERDYMLVRVRTSRPFYGVIHALNYRRRVRCALEGDGASEYLLNISHVLDSRDPAHCGVIKLRRPNADGLAPGEPSNEQLSVVLAIRAQKNVELPDDKFLVLNCTK